MAMSSRLATAIALICAGLGAACQTEPEPAGLSEADRAAIRRNLGNFVKNAQARPRNDRASASYYEEGAVMLAPNQAPIRGRAAIQVFLASFPPFSDYRLETLELEGRGDMAYERGTTSMPLTAPGQPPAAWRSHYLVIWRKQGDGSWKVSREIFTPDAPPTSPERQIPR
jgi:ketosteroid isomerase-like protein